MNAMGHLDRLTHNSDDDVPISFSPEGTRIFFCRSSRMGVMDSDGSNAHDLGEGYRPALSADGRQIVFEDYACSRNWPHERRRLRPPGDLWFSPRLSEPTFTPDGAHVVFVEWPEWNGAGRIKILDIDSTKIELAPEIK